MSVHFPTVDSIDPTDPRTLRDERRRRALTVDQVADHLGVHPTSVLRWERRERLPGPGHVRGLARVLALETAAVADFFDAARSPEAPVGVRSTGLRGLRRRRGVSAAQVAGWLGVPVATVYNWEAGRVRLPDAHLPALAELLGSDPPTLRQVLPRPGTDAPAPVSALRRLRRRTGLSQTAVARRVGVSRTSLGAFERGQRPPLSVVRALAEVYGVAVPVLARAAGVQAPALLDPSRWQPGDLPDVLRVLREWAGLTQAALAGRCGCSVDAVRAWERGRCSPAAASRARLESAFGLPPGALVSCLPR